MPPLKKERNARRRQVRRGRSHTEPEGRSGRGEGRGGRAGGGGGRGYPRSGGAPGGNSSVGLLSKARSRIMQVLHTHRGKDIIYHLKIRPIDTTGKRVHVKYLGLMVKGVTAWVTCLEIHRGGRTTPDL